MTGVEVGGGRGSLSISLLDVPGYLVGLVVFTISGSVYGLWVTAGIPVILAVGIALLLAHLDPDEPTGGRRGPGASDWREYVRPPR